MNSRGCGSTVTFIFVQNAERIILGFASLRIVDRFHGFRVGQDFHVLQQVGHPFPWHDEGDNFAVPRDGGGFIAPAQRRKPRLAFRYGQCILHADST